MSELPKGWINSKLEESIYLNQKFTNIEDDSECGFVPMAMVPTKYGAPIEFEKKTWGKCKKGYTQFQNNDVLLAKITPCFENGKGALVSGLPNGIGAGSTEYFVLRSVGSLVEPKYLHAFVKTRDFLINCETNMSGSVGHRRVPKDYLLNYTMPLAPLAEQKRIVKKLDEILAQVDTIKARLDSIPDLLKRFRQSVLANAVSGKLAVSAGFKTKRLSEVCHILNGARKPVSATKRKNMQGDYPYYGATGVVDYVNGWTHNDRLLLVGEDGANLLTKAKDLAFIVDGKVWVNNHAHVLKQKEQISLDFICLSINALDLSSYVTGSAQPKLTKKTLESLPIQVPSLDKQAEIVRLVDQYFAFADTIEAQVKQAQARVDNLTQSILAKAFRGELVAQDDSDEPAEKLLQRIKQAREEAEALAKAAKKAEAAKKRAAKKAASA